ncbi:twin-arginine translocase TatA/TatE family subunit [Erythrobacter alti]|uniref:twin-arginine translocase TatA/TatE family subunit n=1 Tax=Erythrobacter alti TaxID=1896145 RepID=UPI0030F4AE1B
MGVSVWQILIVAVVVLVLFGRGRISEMMGDFGKGISSFKKGMNEDEKPSSESSPQIEAPAPTPAPTASETTESTTDKNAS